MRARPGLATTGKLRAQIRPVSISSAEGGQRLAVPAGRVGDRVVAGLGWAEGVLHGGVVVEERQKHRDAFDDRGAELGFDPHPVVLEPPLDRLELLPLAGVEPRRPKSGSARWTSNGIVERRRAAPRALGSKGWSRGHCPDRASTGSCSTRRSRRSRRVVGDDQVDATGEARRRPGRWSAIRSGIDDATRRRQRA